MTVGLEAHDILPDPGLTRIREVARQGQRRRWLTFPRLLGGMSAGFIILVFGMIFAPYLLPPQAGPKSSGMIGIPVSPLVSPSRGTGQLSPLSEGLERAISKATGLPPLRRIVPDALAQVRF